MKKLSYEYVLDYYNNFGYKLKSNYINALTKDNLICPEGHEIEMRFNNFKRGQRCSYCAGLKNFTYEFVKKYLNKYNYEFLDKIFINTHSKISIKCPNNHIYKVTFDSFKNNNIRCRKCYENNNKGENHSCWKEDRTRKIRAKYLSFNLDKINILNDDPNYELYLEEKKKETKNIYDIDHIFPRIAFIDNNLDKIYDVKIIKEICNSKDNLRIVNNKENKSKFNRYNQEEFINWFNQKLEKYNETPKNNIE